MSTESYRKLYDARTPTYVIHKTTARGQLRPLFQRLTQADVARREMRIQRRIEARAKP